MTVNPFPSIRRAARFRSAHTIIHRSGARAAQENPTRYMHYVVGDYESYVDTMAKNYEYGTELEAAALAERLGRPVRIWQGYPKVSRGSHLAYRYMYNSKKA